MKLAVFPAILCVALQATSLNAADLPQTSGDEPVCGAPVAAARSEVAKAADASSSPSGFAGNPFVVWHVPGEAPVTKLAVRMADATWKAFAIQEAGQVQGAFASKGGAALIATMHTVEGPGAEFVTIATIDGGTTFKCGGVKFPSTLNEPTWSLEYLSFSGFQGLSGKSGTLLTTVENDEDNSVPFQHYLYTTSDGGMTWSDPKGLKAAGMLPGGDYEPLRQGIDPALLATMPDRF